jgi:16S rRNA processing protein RimM
MPPLPGKPPLVITGRVIKPYGVNGWVKVEPLTANPRRFQPGNAFILEGRERGERLSLEEARQGSGALLAKFQGLDSREDAEKITGRLLMVTPQEVGEAPEGEVWEHQLLGAKVRTREGRHLGEVSEVLETGANDVLVVQGDREYLIPMTREVVVEIDLEEGTITIEPLPGLLEE